METRGLSWALSMDARKSRNKQNILCMTAPFFDQASCQKKSLESIPYFSYNVYMFRFVIAFILAPFIIWANAEKKMVIVIPSYNNEALYKQNLDSVYGQEYCNYRVIYINDCSSDDTASAEFYIAAKNQMHRTQFINNKIRKLAVHNIYDAVWSCQDDEIIVLVDGDDELDDPFVLQHLNEIYSQNEIVMTYGNFRYLSTGEPATWVRPYPAYIIASNTFRTSGYFTGMGHLRTFYAGLFKNIREEDLKYEGEFLKSAYDAAMLYPMIEMAGFKHLCVDKVLLRWNDSNPISDHKVDRDLQKRMNDYILQKVPYAPLMDSQMEWRR